MRVLGSDCSSISDLAYSCFHRFKYASNRRNVVVFVIIVTLATAVPLILSSTGLGLAHTNPGGSGGSQNGQSSGPGYTFFALAIKNFQQLKANSTIIIVGTVSRINTTDCKLSIPTDDCGRYPGDIATIFQVNVESHVKGSGPQSILVWESPFQGNPLMSVGNKYVLFLSNNWDCGPNPQPVCYRPPTPLSLTYAPVGGSQGKFLVTNGLVYGYKTLYPRDNDWIKVDANGVPLDQFIAGL